MNFRRFTDADAAFCFRVRTSAFIRTFYKDIGSEAVEAAVCSYLPSDFIRLSKTLVIFIVEEENERVGFISAKRINNNVAEFPFVYFDLNKLGMRYGSRSIAYLEKWIAQNWQDVHEVFIDTIVPQYNGGFYEKMEYHKTGESICNFGDVNVPAVRFLKYLTRNQNE